MKISLIIPFYKRTDFLELIFQCLARQSYRKFEVIVAEDNNDKQTLAFLDEQRKQYDFPILHIQQEDKGFRKNKAMNKAVAKATGELLVFIDGDCLPHPEFLNEYAKVAKEKVVLWGRRIMLSEDLTNDLLNSEESVQLPSWMAIASSSSTKKEEAIYSHWLNKWRGKERNIKGCNWGILKEDLLAINGFDEDYVLATVGEDDDVEWRLKQVGYTKQSLKNLAIVYHLYHPANYNETSAETNNKLLQQKQEEGIAYVKKGVDQYL